LKGNALNLQSFGSLGEGGGRGGRSIGPGLRVKLNSKRSKVGKTATKEMQTALIFSRTRGAGGSGKANCKVKKKKNNWKECCTYAVLPLPR